MGKIIEPVRGYETAEKLRAVARTYCNLANIYTNIIYENVEKTVVKIYLVDEGERFRHFTFVLSEGRTRVTIPDLTEGRYVAEVTQYDREGRFESTSASFSIVSPTQGYDAEIVNRTEGVRKNSAVSSRG